MAYSKTSLTKFNRNGSERRAIIYLFLLLSVQERFRDTESLARLHTNSIDQSQSSSEVV